MNVYEVLTWIDQKKRMRMSTSPVKNTNDKLNLPDSPETDDENPPSRLNLRGLARQEEKMSKEEDSFTKSQSTGREFARRRLF